MSCVNFLKEVDVKAPEELEKLHTRQLLAELRRTYAEGHEFWGESDWDALRDYRGQIKTVLATREHIPNKLESKAMRKARKKKGN